MVLADLAGFNGKRSDDQSMNTTALVPSSLLYKSLYFRLGLIVLTCEHPVPSLTQGYLVSFLSFTFYSNLTGGEHVFLTRARSLDSVFLMGKINVGALQQKPSAALLADTVRLLDLERQFWRKLNEKGGVVDTFATELQLLVTTMEAYQATGTGIIDAAWLEGLTHARRLIDRLPELRIIPEPARTCTTCGGLYPPVVVAGAKGGLRGARHICHSCHRFSGDSGVGGSTPSKPNPPLPPSAPATPRTARGSGGGYGDIEGASLSASDESSSFIGGGAGNQWKRAPEAIAGSRVPSPGPNSGRRKLRRGLPLPPPASSSSSSSSGPSTSPKRGVSACPNLDERSPQRL